MNRFWKLAPWITRFLALPTALFAAIGIRYLTNVAAVGERGIAFTSGMGMPVGRVGFGAFPLACSLFFSAACFPSAVLLTALAFVATLDSVVLAVRVVSMFADSSIPEKMDWCEPKYFYWCCPPPVCSLSLAESGEPPDRRSRRVSLRSFKQPGS